MRHLGVVSVFVVLAACGDGGEGDQQDAAVDPCAACLPSATCNAGGDPVCACPAGFTGDGTISGTGCTDIDECTQNHCVDIASGGTCTNTAGSVTCGCSDGYTGDGKLAGTGCTNIDECATAADDCVDATAGGTCTDTAGGFTCGCATGYTGDGTTAGTGCTNVDECATATSGCVAATAGGTCMDTAGGFTCGCATGYTGDGATTGTGCTNLDECAMNTDNCVDAAAGGACVDTAGGFTCGCAAGFTGDGTMAGTGCTDIDECTVTANACGYAACTNTVGSFSCSVLYAPSPFQNLGWVIHPATYQVIGSFSSALPNATVMGLNGIATDPTTGTQYAIAKVSGVAGRVLATVDFQPGVANLTQIGDLGDKFASLAFREDGQLFGVTGDGATVPETLFMINKATGATTVATALGNGGDGEAIVYNPDDDFLYHFSGNSTVVFEKIQSTPPYTVTNIPITGATSGEPFGGMYLGAGQILISNINSSFNVVGVDGTWGPRVGSFADDVRGVVKGSVSPNAFRVTPSTVSSAGGDMVTVTGSFAADTSSFTVGGTATAATMTPSQLTFTTVATMAGTQPLVADGSSVKQTHIGDLTFVDPMPRRIGSAEEMKSDDDGGCSAGSSGSVGALGVLGFAVLVPRRRRRRAE